MDENSLDMEALTGLVLNLLEQMKDTPPGDMAAALDSERLQKTILETLGMAKQHLSPEEQEGLNTLFKNVLMKAQGR